MTSELDQPYRLNGKVALVTGGASGIGAATCRELTRAGAEVIIADVNLKAAQAFAKELQGARALEMDVTNAKSIAKAVKEIARLDILVNNAGIGLVGDIASTEEEDFDRVMHVNVYSVFLVTKALIPLLLATRGSIVNIGSVAGQVGVKKRFAYCASKGAVLAMTRQIAVDYPKELRCNCIAPGTVQTPFVEAYLEKYRAKLMDQMVREEVRILKRSGYTREDVLELLHSLATVPPEKTRGSISGQVAAAEAMGKIMGLVVAPRNPDEFFKGRSEEEIAHFAEHGSFAPPRVM